MAMILAAFVGRYVNKLSGFMEEEMSMMQGVENELKKLLKRMEEINGFLESAERKRHADQNINIWVRELKDVMYDADDIMDRCMIERRRLLEDHPSESAVRRPSFLFSCLSCIKFRHEIGNEIRKLNDRLKVIAEDRLILPSLEYTRQDVQMSGVNHRQTSPYDEVESNIVGRQIEEDTKSLVESLIEEDNKKYQVLGIVGMGGIGKTTLASNIYNHESIKNNFPIRVWACVSQDFSDIKLLKNIIRVAGGEYKEDETKAELKSRLSSLLSNRFFIVLDDVWTADVWEDLLRNSFEHAIANGRIVVTTRDVNVVETMRADRNMKAYIHHVKKMDNDCGWEMLRKKIFGEDDDEEEISNLKEIGVEIVKKCDGLPLAIKTIAGVLSLKGRTNMEWDKVLKNDVWSMSQLDEKLPKALFLSYEDLSSDLKQCFLYCSLFPEDWIMHRDYLVQLWVAEGFVERTQGHMLMEDLAEDNYSELINRNLLELCLDNDDSRCRMHDLLRSLALFLIRDESIFLCDGQSPNVNPLTKIRRMSMMNMEERVEVPDAIKQQKCLRSLLLWVDGSLAQTVENKLFGRLRLLRVIKINDIKLESLPDSIGDLLHLRYLDLERTDIKDLPKSIGRLVNLQTLNLSSCTFLHTLPKAITKLCNLRCLRIQGTLLTHVPKEIGRLKHLNHLEGFVIGHDDRRDAQDDEGCDLKELQSLSLRFLSIRRLERAQPGGALVLANSRSLRTLILECRPPKDEEKAIEIQRNDRIYNELSPQSTHLQKLEIYNFIGTGFVNWMMSSSLGASFPNLTSIQLHNCISSPQLPPLGLLPQLKSLHIKNLDAIKIIGPEFLGLRASSSAISFPKLEELRFWIMDNWEEWSFGMVEGVGEERRGAPKLLPRLKNLYLRRCPNLRALPPLGLLPQLKSLRIDGAYAIKTIGPEFLGPRASSSAATSFPKLEELEFHGMSNWEEWSFGMVEGVGEERRGAPELLPHLTTLHLEGCPNLRALPPLGQLPELKFLKIWGAGAIKTIGPEFLGPRASSAATSFPNLEELKFGWMNSWEEWSFGMVKGVGEERRGTSKLLPRLSKLILCHCPELRALPPLGLLPQLKSFRIESLDAIKTIGPEFLGPRASSAAILFPKLEELEFHWMRKWEEWSFGMVEGVGEERRGDPELLPHLTKLRLYMCPKLRALPDGLRHATSLQELKIFQLKDLIEINNLPSLKSLEIDYCEKLEHVENLDKLQYLKVRLCTGDDDGQTTERLPQWLLDLLEQHPLPNLQKFDLTCRLPLLKTFLKDGPNWPIIQSIPQVNIQELRYPTSYIQYTKDPPTFEMHINES